MSLLTSVKNRVIGTTIRTWWEHVTGIEALKKEIQNLHKAESSLTEQYRACCLEASMLKVLLDNAAIRTAPQRLYEIQSGSNKASLNACYIHPNSLMNVPGYTAGLSPIAVKRDVHGLIVICPVSEGIYLLQCTKSVIVATSLMPKHGVIFAPLHEVFLRKFGLSKSKLDSFQLGCFVNSQ